MKHFIITGDTGSGSIDQYKVSHSMIKLIQKKPIKSIILLGDNIYENGCNSIHDKKFITKFEKPYQYIDKPFYLCLGNHDYGLSYNPLQKDFLKDNSQIQIDYSKHSHNWNMPAKYYKVIDYIEEKIAFSRYGL